MAFSLNRAQIIGNVTRDPEVRVAGTQKVASFSVATNFSWTDQATGQRKEKVEYHNVVAWRRLAEICEQYLRKGTKVYIEGRIQTRDWEGEDGIKRYRTEIIADNMIMLGGRGSPMAENMSSGAGAADTDGMPSAGEGRAARSIRVKTTPAGDETASSTSGGVPKEEEISIDDLPF